MPSKEKKQSYIEHLTELRSRLLRCTLIVVGAFISLIYFSNDIYQFVANPLQTLLSKNSSMIATEVASPFLSPLKLTFYVSLLISIPYVLYEVWGFIAPGMYQKERKFVVTLTLISIFLFYIGILFAYYLVFPLIFSFFTTVGPEGITVMTDIGRYLDFILSMFLAFAIAFEMPVFIFLLNWSGITTPESLSEKRPYIIISCFVLGMFLTPPDAISQILLAVPAWFLFEVGLLLSRVFVKSSTKTREQESD